MRITLAKFKSLLAEFDNDIEKVKQLLGEDLIIEDDDGNEVDVEMIVKDASNDDGGEATGIDYDKLATTIAKSITKAQAATPAPIAVQQDAHDGFSKSFVVPTRAKRYGTLKGFSNTPQGEAEAYAFGKWLQGHIVGSKSARQWCKDHGYVSHTKADQQEDQDIIGGALVPDQYVSTLIRLVEQYGVFRQNARILPMTSDYATQPRRTAGLSANWIGEGTAITQSAVKFDLIGFTAKKLATLTTISSELSEDASVAIASAVTDEIAQEFALEEDTAGFNGTGVSANGGITGVTVKIDDGNHTASVVDAASGNTGFETLDDTDFTACVGKLPLYAHGNAKWYISNAGYGASMLRLLRAGGGNTTMTLAGRPQLQFAGYPVVLSQVLDNTLDADASVIKVLFGDLSKAATLADRRAVSIARSDERYFDQDLTAIRGIERLDINVHDLGDTTDAGPLVALKTAAS